MADTDLMDYETFPGWPTFLYSTLDSTCRADQQEQEYEIARDLAARWDTCAIGEAHRRQPLVVRLRETETGPKLGGPVDETLFSLGLQFSFAIDARDFADARDIYAEIQARVQILEGLQHLAAAL